MDNSKLNEAYFSAAILKNAARYNIEIPADELPDIRQAAMLEYLSGKPAAAAIWKAINAYRRTRRHPLAELPAADICVADIRYD